jgi:hypothetical protein
VPGSLGAPALLPGDHRPNADTFCSIRPENTDRGLISGAWAVDLCRITVCWAWRGIVRARRLWVRIGGRDLPSLLYGHSNIFEGVFSRRKHHSEHATSSVQNDR